MALWKPFRGNRADLDAVEKHDGYVYFCIDDGTLFFDYLDSDGNLERKQVNADYIRSLLPKSTTISLPAANWTGVNAPFSQVVEINGVTANSKIDLQPSIEQLATLQEEEVSLVASNNDGVVTVYAFNYKPSVDFDMQALIVEVVSV